MTRLGLYQVEYLIITIDVAGIGELLRIFEVLPRGHGMLWRVENALLLIND